MIISFYNVENLFPPDDFQFPKLGLKGWDKPRYDRKIRKIARVFELMKAYNGTLPTLTGLAEVSDASVLEDLLAMPVFADKYAFIHYNSMDERGVDVALIYHKNKIRITNTEAIPFSFEIEDHIPDNYDTTRDVLKVEAEHLQSGVVFQMFVVHLPSKREKDINRPKRRFILDEIKRRIVEDFDNQDKAIVVCGDFNENPYESNIQNFAKELLINPFEKLYDGKRFSAFHKGKGMLFDQILLSQHWFSQEFPFQFSEAKVFDVKELFNRDRSRKGQPYRTYAGTRYLGGYSDHFPVLVALEPQKTK